MATVLRLFALTRHGMFKGRNTIFLPILLIGTPCRRHRKTTRRSPEIGLTKCMLSYEAAPFGTVFSLAG
jgi:hypothetical protein